MSNQCNYVCYDFTPGGIVTTPAQARRALKENYAEWLAEQEESAASETAANGSVSIHEQELETGVTA